MWAAATYEGKQRRELSSGLSSTARRVTLPSVPLHSHISVSCFPIPKTASGRELPLYLSKQPSAPKPCVCWSPGQCRLSPSATFGGLPYIFPGAFSPRTSGIEASQLLYNVHRYAAFKVVLNTARCVQRPQRVTKLAGKLSNFPPWQLVPTLHPPSVRFLLSPFLLLHDGDVCRVSRPVKTEFLFARVIQHLHHISLTLMSP